MNLCKKLLASLLSIALFITGMPMRTYADTAVEGKYVKDIFIAYGHTEEEARKWLLDNGWEPIKGNGDFNSGKVSGFDDNFIVDQNVAAVMGIKRTANAKEAITDLAVMNMKGGYSFPDYEKLIEAKKTEITEFENSFMPVIEEYRKNYNSEGSSLGKKRADMAHDMLNRFYDGGEDEEYALADTGMPLGDLFLNETRSELGEKAYKALNPEEKKKHGDLQQILLEASGPALLIMEQMLAFASDNAENTWLERLTLLSGEGLISHISEFVPEAIEKDLAPSAVNQLLLQYYEDAAELLASQWIVIHDEMTWFEKYSEEHDLWDSEGESEEEHANRISNWFKELEKKDPDAYNEDYNRFINGGILYNSLYEVSYSGEWGKTLGDFFNPFNRNDYGLDASYFLPFAAALSKGQRAALEEISLYSLLLMGLTDERGYDRAKPDLDKVFEGKLSMSVYTGINRGIFRGGVALTNRALMEQNSGRGEVINTLYDPTGILAIASYAAAATGLIFIVSGAVMAVKGKVPAYSALEIAEAKKKYDNAAEVMDWVNEFSYDYDIKLREFNTTKEEYHRMSSAMKPTKMGIGGRVLLGVGAVLMLGAAFVNGYQLYRYYQRTFTQIPLMIVDEADIVTYTTDSEGNSVRNIDFDQYIYYEAVKCNRQQVGEIGDWQSGVSDYASWGCGDAADLNADCGQEWLALYKVNSEKKGNPILADSLVLQYGSDKRPAGTTKALHLFSYTYAADLGDTAWAFNNARKGIYFFWDEDANAYKEISTASAFTTGQLALFTFGGLLVGILGASFITIKARKKDEE